MKRIRDFSIQSKLLFSYSVIGIIALLIGVAGFNGIYEIMHHQDVMYDVGYTQMRLLNEINTALLMARGDIRVAISVKEEQRREKYIRTALESGDRINKLLDQFTRTIVSPVQKDSVQVFTSAWRRYLLLRDPVIAFLRAGREDEAQKRMDADVSLAMIRSRSILFSLNTQVAAIIEEENEKADAASRNATLFLLIVLVVGGALTVRFAMSISRIVTAPLKRDLDTLRVVNEERMKKINDCFLSFSAEPAENIDRLVTLAGEILDAGVAMYNRREGKQFTTVAIAQKSGIQAFPRDLYCTRLTSVLILDTDKLVMLDLLQEGSTIANEYFRANELKTFVGKAVKIERATVGTLCLFFGSNASPGTVEKDLLGIIASAIEVEEKRRSAKDALRESEERFRTLYEKSTIGLYRSTPDGNIILANSKLVSMLGYETFGDLSARNCKNREFEPAYGRRRFFAHLESVTEVQDVESMWTCADGSIMYVSESARAIRNSNGTIMFIDGSINDITERKLALTQLRESEARQAALIANISDAIAIIDETGVIIYQSENIEKLFGWKSNELIGRSYDEPIHPDDVERIKKAFNSIVAREGSSLTLEFKLLSRDGSIRSILLTATNLIHEPIIKGVLVNYQDITSRKNAEIALRESDDRLRRAEEVAMTGNWKILLDRRMIQASDGAIKIYGFDQNDLQLAEVQALALPEYRAQLDKAITDLVNHGVPYEQEYKIRHRTTGDIISLHSKAEYNAASHVIFGVVQDVTQQKRLEHQLLQSQKLEGVGTLAGGIAHDFNNLLAMILGSAELLQRQLPDHPKMSKYIARIIEASERGKSISRQLLIFSRPDQAELKPISLSQTIAEVDDLLKHFLPKTIAIETIIRVDHGIILGDAGQIHQSLLNLAINAGDSMTNHGTLTIMEVSVSPEFIAKRFNVPAVVPYVALSVTDTGTGIPESELGKIFNPFYSTKEKGKGTGLGLAMVHGIVKNHKGFIDVESVVGSGTTFTMYFPAVMQNVEEYTIDNRLQTEHPHATILLVDDEEHIREMLTDFLEECGYHVYATSNGEEALQLFETHHRSIDLVITDLGMPKMGGEELYKRMKKIDANVTVMVSSGYLDGATKEHLIHTGIRDVLTKPSKLQDIQNAILSALAKD